MSKIEVGEILDIALAQFEDLDIAQTMTAVAIAESFGGEIDAIGDGGSSVGLWQINRIHFEDLIDYGIITVPPEVRASLDEGSEENSKALWKEYAHPQLFDPATNAKAAWMVGWNQGPSWGSQSNTKALEGEFNFDAWSMYSNGTWQTAPVNDEDRFLAGTEWAEMSPIDAVLQVSSSMEVKSPLTSLDDGPGDSNFQPPPPTAPSDQPSPWGARPQMPGAKGPRWGDTKAIFDRDSYNKRIQQAMKDKNTPKVMPLHTRLSGSEFEMLIRSTDDKALKSALSRHKESLLNGDGGILGYETDEAANAAPNWLRSYGIEADPEFPFLARSLGTGSIDKDGNIEDQFWNLLVGSLWESDGVEGNSDGMEGKSNYE